MLQVGMHEDWFKSYNAAIVNFTYTYKYIFLKYFL
jgi:hypothetical protein